jgi:hypothetical protein
MMPLSDLPVARPSAPSRPGIVSMPLSDLPVARPSAPSRPRVVPFEVHRPTALLVDFTDYFRANTSEVAGTHRRRGVPRLFTTRPGDQAATAPAHQAPRREPTRGKLLPADASQLDRPDATTPAQVGLAYLSHLMLLSFRGCEWGPTPLSVYILHPRSTRERTQVCILILYYLPCSQFIYYSIRY